MSGLDFTTKQQTGVDGYSSEYKKDITFNVLSPNGERVEQWVLKGAFITTANLERIRLRISMK